jgi:hypothetical protein
MGSVRTDPAPPVACVADRREGKGVLSPSRHHRFLLDGFVQHLVRESVYSTLSHRSHKTFCDSLPSPMHTRRLETLAQPLYKIYFCFT